MAPGMTASATVTTSARSSVGPTKPKSKVNSNGYHPIATIPLSAMSSTALDLTSVERRGQPTATREPIKKATRPHGISDAPTYCPTAEEWREPLEYIKKIGLEASQYGICKIIPPDSWNPEFAIDTEVRLHLGHNFTRAVDLGINICVTDSVAEIPFPNPKTGTQLCGGQYVFLSSLQTALTPTHISPQAHAQI